MSVVELILLYALVVDALNDQRGRMKCPSRVGACGELFTETYQCRTNVHCERSPVRYRDGVCHVAPRSSFQTRQPLLDGPLGKMADEQALGKPMDVSDGVGVPRMTVRCLQGWKGSVSLAPSATLGDLSLIHI